MELNTTILSQNERVCSLSKSQEYNLTLNCSKTSLWKKVTYCDLNEIFFQLKVFIFFIDTCNATDWNVGLRRLFSVIIVYVRSIFATIRLRLFSTNIDENEVCTKKINRKSRHSASFIKKWALFARLINYFEIGNLFCDQIIMY